MIKIDEAHKQLLEAQASQEPVLTLREMGRVIGANSTAHVSFILDKLVDMGLAEKIQRGSKHIYRIVSGYKHNKARHE